MFFVYVCDVSCPSLHSFSQFSTRCKKEWVSLKSSAGREPVVLCGATLPEAIEFPGGNVTVVHHFLPHLFPVSSFLLSYTRGAVSQCMLLLLFVFPASNFLLSYTVDLRLVYVYAWDNEFVDLLFFSYYIVKL